MPFYPVGPSVLYSHDTKKTKTSASWWQRSEKNEISFEIYAVEILQ
jgi:hypothetical protein